MNSQPDKENSLLGSNIISIKPLKSRKHKSLETKISQSPHLNIYFPQDPNSNQKIKHIFSQQADTPEFGLYRKNRLQIKPKPKNGRPLRWKQYQKSSDFELKMHSIDVGNFHPLIQKSNKIPDIFFKAIQCNTKPLKDFDTSTEKRGNSLNHHKYLPELNFKKDKYKLFQPEKVDFKLNPQKNGELMKIFPLRTRQQTNINLLRNKMKKML